MTETMTIPKMDQRIKTEWVKRLRSDQYKQGSSVLVNEQLGTHCCLGVLCEIAAEEGIVKRIPQATFDESTQTVISADGSEVGFDDLDSVDGVIFVGADTPNSTKNSSDAVLMEAVVKWAGIDTGVDSAHTDASPSVPGEGNENGYVTLYELNDGGESFPEIANRIEAHL